MSLDVEFAVMSPELQVSLHHRLQEVRQQYFGEALQRTVAGLDIPQLDGELATYAGAVALAQIAALGLRGEALFPVPYLLRAQPRLLGYYRLLYGLSEKAFYSPFTFGSFKALEARGVLSSTLAERLPALCLSLAETARALLDGTGDLSLAGIHELQLLTLGPTFRGSELNRIGQRAVAQFQALLRSIAGDHLLTETNRSLVLRNASDREVSITFADDPDVRVTELSKSGEQPKLSIEIKGGADASNVYNRIGEAEKSHLKARQNGYFEFWTIVRADFKPARAVIDSPTTSRFFRLDRIADPGAAEFQQFRDALCSVLGIPVPPD